MPVHAHRSHTAGPVRCAVVTVSDTRSPADDTSGGRIKELLAAAGHEIAAYGVVADDPPVIAARARELLRADGVQAVIFNGGTGLAPRDSTVEALRPLLEKEITGFGELFRFLSYQDIGAAAMLSRATAGVAWGRILVLLPGSTPAVELAMTKLVLPELSHMVFLAGRRGPVP
jgi:molybdenum cofactor biosynthesis protein B